MEKACLRSALPYKSILLFLVMLSMAGMAVAQSQAPPEQKPESLADAARKAKAKKAKSEPGKVYTDEDVSGRGQGGISVVGQEGAAASGAQEERDSDAKSARGAAGTAKNEEAMWRAKAQKIKDQMKAVDDQIAQLKEDIKKNGASGFDASSGLQKNVIYVNDKNARLQRLEQKRADLDKQMDQLGEEGRKAGMPASLFR